MDNPPLMNGENDDAEAMANSTIERLSKWKQNVYTASEEYKKAQEEFVRLFASKEKTTTETKTIVTENKNNNNKFTKKKKKKTTTTTTMAVTTTLDCSQHKPMEVELAELQLFEAYNVLRMTYEEYYIGCIQRQLPIQQFIVFTGCDIALGSGNIHPVRWQCRSCTLINAGRNLECTACGRRRLYRDAPRTNGFFERPQIKRKFQQMWSRISRESKDFLKSSKKNYEKRRMNMYRCLHRCNNNNNTFQVQQVNVKDENKESSSIFHDDANDAVSTSSTSGVRSNKRRKVDNHPLCMTNNGANFPTTTSTGTSNSNSNKNADDGGDDDDDDVTALMFKEAQVLSKSARGIEAIGKRTLKQLWGDDASLHKRYKDENYIWLVNGREKSFKNQLEFLLERQQIVKAISGQYIGDNSNNDIGNDLVVERNNCERYRLAHNKHSEIKQRRQYVTNRLKQELREQDEREREPEERELEELGQQELVRLRERQPQFRQLFASDSDSDSDSDDNNFMFNRNNNNVVRGRLNEIRNDIIDVDHVLNDNDNDNDNNNAIANAENDDTNENNIDNPTGNNINTLEQQLVRLGEQRSQARKEMNRAEQVLTASIRPCFQRLFNYSTNNNNDIDVLDGGGDRDDDLDDHNNNNEDEDEDDDTNVAVVVDIEGVDDVNNDNNGNREMRKLIGAFNTLKEKIEQEEIEFTEEWNRKKEAMKLNAYYNWFCGNNGVLLSGEGRNYSYCK